MSMIDDRGRLFGRVNVIDAAVIVVIGLLVPIAYAAYQLFRPHVQITAVEPSVLKDTEGARLRIQGSDLRSSLRATVGTTNATLLVESPTSAEVKLPFIPSGTHDLVFYDAAKEVARLAGALTVVGSRTVARVDVRFIAYPAVLELLKVDARDADARVAVQEKSAAASVISFRKEAELSSALSLSLFGGDSRGMSSGSYEIAQPVAIVSAVMRVPVEKKGFAWRYKDEPVKLGATFVFETDLYVMRGVIVRIELASEASGPPR